MLRRRMTYDSFKNILNTTLANGLVSYYQFEGNYLDKMNRYNPVSSSGTITYDKGIVRKGIVLNNSYLSMNTNWGITNYFSFSAWVNVANKEDSIYGFILSVNGDWNSSGLYFYDGYFSACVNNQFLGINDDGKLSGGNSAICTFGKWAFLVITYDGSAIKFYIDGILSFQTAYSSTPTFTPNRTFIGRYDHSTRNLRGMLDSIGVWNRAITASEVAILYNNGKGL